MEKVSNEIRTLFRAFEKAPMDKFLEYLFDGLSQEQKDLLVIDNVDYSRRSSRIMDLSAWFYVKPYDGEDSHRWISVDYMYDSVEETVEEHYCVRDFKRLSSLAECISFYQDAQTKTEGSIPLLIGKTNDGQEQWLDLEECRHLLIAGASSQGKNEFLKNLISQLRDNSSVDVRLFDAKSSAQIAEETDESLNALCQMMEEYHAREDKGKTIVVIIDEYQDYTIQFGRDKSVGRSINNSIVYLLQKGAPVGVHLILATQRPTPEVITPIIKCNIPTRIAFKTFSAMDSKTILDYPGAEKLVGGKEVIYQDGGRMKTLSIVI